MKVGLSNPPTAFFRLSQTGETMVWVPRRSQLKSTFPGALDVTAGGGMCVGDSATGAIVREASEKASPDANFVRQNLRPVSVLSFLYRSPAGWILPGFYYLYELEFQPDGTPRPAANKADGEVEGFELMSVSEILEHLVEMKFKPSSALAMVDFLMRHGYVTERCEKRREKRRSA